MAAEEFEATLAPSEERVLLELRGTVNRNAKERLEAAYRSALEYPGEIILDFAKVDYINSTGIAVIVGILAMARGESREVGAVGLSEHYREVFQITRLSDFMHIYQTDLL
jgi:anti-sigma B factor antagonist